MRYLLVTHIPFARQPGGSVLLDCLWAEDLRGLAQSIGPITIAGPELSAEKMQSWGTGFDTLNDNQISFTGLPSRRNRFDLFHALRQRNALRKAVDNADLVHSSNFFDPNTGLYYAHDLATRRGLKTLFVVAEDFYDMLSWEWVRSAPNSLQRLRRNRALARLDANVRKRIRTSSLTFLHTPAAVARYRLDAANAVAIRQPVHELEDVIDLERFNAKLSTIRSGAPLHIVTASRLQPLKGIDFLIRAIALLESRGVHVQATLYGEGPQRPALQALIEHLGLAQCVTLPGPLAPASALRDVLADGHLFLMPHLSNDFGRAFFDAMAAGCPVVAFRSVASQDTVRDGVDGLLAPNLDPEGLASAIASLHQDRARLTTLATASRNRALQNTKSSWNALRAGWIRELFPE